MKKPLLKVAAAFAVLALGLGTLAGCTGKSSDTPTKITMLVLGDKPTNGRLEAMLTVLNKRLTEQANATLSLHYVEWADWQTQYNLQLLSGDKSVDLITTATDWLFAWENAQKNAFLPLSEKMLKKDAPKTWAQVNASGDWDLTKLDDGQIYFIPEDNYTQYTNHGFFYRGDWAKQAGIPDGTITKFEQFTQYFTWIKQNKPGTYPWDVAKTNESALTGYLQGHTDWFTLQEVTAGNNYPFQIDNSGSTPKVTSWYYNSDQLLAAAQEAKQWNQLGVWREDALNYDGDTREEFFSGLSGTDQHHTQTFVGSIVDNMTKKQPGSDPKMFYWGQENGNVFKDIKTHGAMAVSAYSKHPDKALAVYDLIRNDKTDYDLLNFGIEGKDYVLTADGKIDYPAGYDASKDALGSNFWAGRMNEFEPAKATDAPNKADIFASLNAVAKNYPFSTLRVKKDQIDPTLSAIGGVLSEYIPQLEFGKEANPAAMIAEMRKKLKDAGFEDVLKSIQADLDNWAKTHKAK
jgi:ABC-type glycerol-3-phosphate transport system substrate-binding protein